MTEERLKNIQEKEEILNKAENFFREAEDILERWKEFQPKFKKLIDYYYSDDWQEDYESSNRGEIPQDISHGVLSEDLIYNTLTHQRSLALQYIKLMAEILEEN